MEQEALLIGGSIAPNNGIELTGRERPTRDTIRRRSGDFRSCLSFLFEPSES